MTQLKTLTLDNIEEIKAVYKEIFTKEPWNDDWSNDEQLTLYITELIGNKNSLTYGLFEGDELIGLSMGHIKHWYSSTEYNIDEFCIKTQKQGKGLGTDFLNHIEKAIKSLEINAIFLQTERNVPAYSFYKKNNFFELQNHTSLKKNI